MENLSPFANTLLLLSCFTFVIVLIGLVFEIFRRLKHVVSALEQILIFIERQERLNQSFQLLSEKQNDINLNNEKMHDNYMAVFNELEVVLTNKGKDK